LGGEVWGGLGLGKRRQRDRQIDTQTETDRQTDRERQRDRETLPVHTARWVFDDSSSLLLAAAHAVRGVIGPVL
jgi:hypothetical protein